MQVIGTVLATLLFVWLLRKQDWQAIWANLKLFPVWLWPVYLLLIITGMFCNALRWFLLLRAQKVEIPFWEVVHTVFAGAFASNFLPSTIGGDAFRIISLLRFTSDQGVSLASVVVDRAINVIASFTFLPFAWFTFDNNIFDLIRNTNPASATAVVFPLWNNGIVFFKSLLKHFFAAFASWIHQPLVLIIAFGISWLSISVVYLAIWLLARSLGISVTLVQVIGVAAVVYIVTSLPISFNGYGVREVTYVTLYVYLGASLEQATTLALVSRFFMLIETIPGAFWLSKIIAFQRDTKSNT